MGSRDHLVPKVIVNSRGVATTVYVRPENQIVRASYGATPFKGTGRTGDDVSLNDPYYGSERYERFLKSVYRSADDADVDVESNKRALGLWDGTNEPSGAIDVSGRREDIESVARGICKEFDQYAVRVIYQPGNGHHKMYSFDVGRRDPAIIMETLHEAGIDGARVTGGHVELADAQDLSERSLSTLERIYGKASVTPCEVVRVFGTD